MPLLPTNHSGYITTPLSLQHLHLCYYILSWILVASALNLLPSSDYQLSREVTLILHVSLFQGDENKGYHIVDASKI